jgi:cytochrome c biogenesis protein CcdA/peroxiredoxin
MGILPALLDRLVKSNRMLKNPLTSLTAAIAGVVFILWSFTGSLQPVLSSSFDTTAGSSIVTEWPTIIALIILTVYLLWLVLDGAFSKPQIFWVKVITTFQNVFYADTRRQFAATGRQGFAGSALMGVVFAAGWTPCIGPILGSILGLALSTTGNNFLSAAALLIAYSLGLGIPFLVTALMLDSAQGLLRRLQRYMHQIELIIGAFLVFIGVAVATGQLQSLSQNATNRFSDFSVSVENCGVGFLTGEINFSHLRPCLSGETPLFKIGNTVQNQFETSVKTIQYIFRAAAGNVLDIDLKDRSNTLRPVLKVYDDNQNQLISGKSIGLTDKNEAIVAIHSFVVPHDGIYSLAISPSEGNETFADNPFTLSIKLANPNSDTKSAEPTSIPPTSAVSTGLGSITDAAAAMNSPISGTNIGDVAPDFQTVTEIGKTTRLSDYRGQVVLLNFWGTWCGPCRVEMPAFETAYNANKETGFTILAVNNRDTPEAVAAFRGEFGLSFPLVMDDGAAIAKTYGVFSFPSTYVLNQHGVITARHFGALTAEQIQELVTQALT